MVASSLTRLRVGSCALRNGPIGPNREFEAALASPAGRSSRPLRREAAWAGREREPSACGRRGPAPASTASWGAVPRSRTTKRQHARKGGVPGGDNTRTPLTRIRTSIAQEKVTVDHGRPDTLAALVHMTPPVRRVAGLVGRLRYPLQAISDSGGRRRSRGSVGQFAGLMTDRP